MSKEELELREEPKTLDLQLRTATLNQTLVMKLQRLLVKMLVTLHQPLQEGL